VPDAVPDDGLHLRPAQRPCLDSDDAAAESRVGVAPWVARGDVTSLYESPPRFQRADGTVRVASVPASHVYVRHLGAPDGHDPVVRLADVAPADGETVPGGWWPPVMLDAAWIAANAADFDVFHVHFGFDAKTPAELEAVCEALAAAGVPLVVTVHDLRNPHHDDDELHRQQLGMLLAHAAAVITLTRGAAEAIERRWGVTAQVLPHPHVLPRIRLGAPRRPHPGFIVGLHAKSLRPNMDVPAVAGALAGAVAGLPGARLQINLHDEVFDPGNYWYAPDVGEHLRALARSHDRVELVEHAYFDDEELWDYLASLDVSVLPYRFGTHSGWLEACFDLGTTVVAPSCGFYAQQRPCLIYRHDDDGLDADALVEAVRVAHATRPHWQARREERLRERGMLAMQHAHLYRRLLEG
jgi:glycosyltransferase involved in cell wall biosynthesis